MSRPDVPFASETNLIIGIDFGTTFTGVAYAYQSDTNPRPTMSVSEMRRINQNMCIIKEWPSQSGATFGKTPTIIAYKNNGEPGNWGARVRPRDSPQVAHFKLGLQENANSMYKRSELSVLGGYMADHDWRHPQLPHKSAVDVTSDYLKSIVQYVLTDQLPRNYGQEFLLNQNISYITTVPAVWSEKAKELTRQAGVDAGIPRNRITLITEPEAAAYYCSILCEKVDLKQRDRFLVCDAGGGTVVRFPSLPNF